MSYKIKYGSYKYDKKGIPRKNIVIASSFAFFALIVMLSLCFPEEVSVIRRIVFPFFEPEVVDAFGKMLQGIGEGDELSDAAAAFCREIINQSVY